MTSSTVSALGVCAMIAVMLAWPSLGWWRSRRGIVRGTLSGMSDLSETNDFEKETVEEFLKRALDPSFIFDAQEWADQPEKEEPKKTKAPSKLPAKFEPPVARMHCTGCQNNWDAWVDDDGTLQDERDAYCACSKGGYVTLAEE